MFDTKTKRFTTPHMAELAYLATLAAVEAPVRANEWASNAKIPWHLIHAIRELLAKDGFDWKKAATDHKRLEHEEKLADRKRRFPSEYKDGANT